MPPVGGCSEITCLCEYFSHTKRDSSSPFSHTFSDYDLVMMLEKQVNFVVVQYCQSRFSPPSDVQFKSQPSLLFVSCSPARQQNPPVQGYLVF